MYVHMPELALTCSCFYQVTIMAGIVPIYVGTYKIPGLKAYCWIKQDKRENTWI